MVILEETTLDDDNVDLYRELEMRWIAKMKTMGHPLTNANFGQDGVHLQRQTDETRKKLSEASVKLWQDPDFRVTQREGVLRYYRDPANKGKARERANKWPRLKCDHCEMVSTRTGLVSHLRTHRKAGEIE
jgi:hypothetical protein